MDMGTGHRAQRRFNVSVILARRFIWSLLYSGRRDTILGDGREQKGVILEVIAVIRALK